MTRLSALLASLALALTLAPGVALAADPGWPRTHTAGGYTVEVFQPQVEKWTGYQVLEFRAALSVATAGQTEPAFGIVVGTAKTQVDWNARQVAITEPKWTSITFPGATGAVADSYVAAVRLAFPEGKTQEIALDRVIANLQRTQEQQRPVEVNLDPPPIFYRSGPALLVVFTGPPAMKPLAGTSLLFATNTNWTVLLDTSTALYYLLDDDSWLTAPDLVNGPWTAATSLPGAFYTFPDDGNWTYARAHMPGHLPAVLPSVVVSTQPAELIVTTGAPQMMSVAGTDLLYVTNTSSDLFLDYANGTYYFLTAGRWFSTKDLNGPWSAATKTLPASFAKIPLDSPKARALASVPGTPQAAEAVLQASIPHTAKVDPANTTITVPYQGAPVFAPVAGSENVAAASNTSYAVFEVGGGFYCCHAGIWFQAMAATGPWAVCTKVPPAMYSIPATSPYHEVTYCYVYDASPTSVTVGYTSGYTGAYVVGGLLMFGAGYWAASAVAADTYAAWHYPASYYSYGTAAHYDYYAGAYTRGAAYYGPYGGAGYGAQYNPATGTYARGATAYGPYGGSASAVQAYNPWTGATAHGASVNTAYGSAGYASGYNPSTGRGAATEQESGPYGSWGKSVASNGYNSVETGHTSTAAGQTAGFQSTTGASGAVHQGPSGTTSVAQSKNGDVYAGHDGNVYKYNPSSSSWDKNTGSGWQSTGWNASAQEHPASKPAESPQASGGETHQQLNNDAASRSYGDYRSSGSSYGGGGGGGGESRWGGGGGESRGGGGGGRRR